MSTVLRQFPADDDEWIGLNAAEVEALRTNDWFSLLPLALQRALLQHCAIWHVPAHHIMVTQGSVPDVWFGLAAGALKLSISSTGGRETVIHSYRHRFSLEPGDPAVEATERRLTERPPIRVAETTSTVEELTGKAPRSLTEWLTDNLNVFRA